MISMTGRFVNRIRWVFALGFLFLFITVVGQYPMPKVFTVYNELSNNKVNSIFQDSRGFLWIGTEDGLNRYDGYNMLIYRHQPLDSTSISGNLIQAICETPDGNIWVGTRNFGLNKWDRKRNIFVRFMSDPNNPYSLPENEICGLMVAKDSSLWIKTRNFLVHLPCQSDRFVSFGHFSNVFKSEKYHRYPILEWNDGSILVGTKDGLNKFNIIENTFSRIVGGEQSNPLQDAIAHMINHTDSSVLVGTHSGIKEFFVDREVFASVKSSLLSVFEQEAGVLLRSRDDKLFVGSKKGLECVNSDFTQAYSLLKLSNDEITSVLEDRSGLIWAGTQHNGLFKFDLNPPKFSSVSAANTDHMKAEVFNFTSVFADDNHHIWLGTPSKGMYLYNRRSGGFSHFILDQGHFERDDDGVFAIFCDSRKNIWIGTNHGLYIANELDHRIREFDYCNNNEFATLLKENQIKSIAEDQLNNIWIGTKFGLYKYNGKTIESYFCEPKDPNSLCDDEINALLFDPNEGLWVGTKNGINVFRSAQNDFQRIQNTTLQPFLLSSDYILSLSNDSKGNIWIGTGSGLTCFNTVKRNTLIYTKKDGLDNDVVNGVICDDFGRVWLSTNKGISFIGPNHSVLNFSPEDGLAGYIFNVGAICRNSEGELFFGGVDGLSYLYPGLIKLNVIKPNVVITSIRLINQGEIANEWTGETDVVKFRYEKNSSLRFDFSALEFTQPGRNQYKVMLEGFDKDWQYLSSHNFISYTNLPSGEYRFKVVGSNGDLVWNDKWAEIKITVVAPLWRSNYAYVFYAIIFIAFVQSIINYRVRNYRKAYQNLKEKAVDKKKIEAQKEALSRINKSLTDSINYAKRIQEAMLPSDQMIKQYLNESFIYYRPKDIVSGDFYYFYEKSPKVFIASVDCTGHGVPGAFMSIIGFDILRNIIEIQGIDCPASVLNELNRQLLEIFKKDSVARSQSEVNDGMDMSMMVIDYQQRILEYSGANSSIYLVRDNEISCFDGDRYPIGFSNDYNLFSKQEIPLLENDILYLFSDGYTDQFGGPEGKKFKFRRFRHLLLNIHKLPFEDQKAILHQKMEEWMGNTHEQVDDMLLIGLKLNFES